MVDSVRQAIGLTVNICKSHAIGLAKSLMYVCGTAFSDMTRWSSSFGGRWPPGGWRARTCSSGRRGSASGGLRWSWPGAYCVSATADDALEPCGECESCRLFAAGNHPDLEVVGLPPDKSELPIALFIGDDQHRNQEGLCHRIALKPFLGGRRVAIIDDADHFNASSANCLLKTLEEPPPRSLLILIGTSPAGSCRRFARGRRSCGFSRWRTMTVAQILLDTGAAADRSEAARLAALSEGSVERAMRIGRPGAGGVSRATVARAVVGIAGWRATGTVGAGICRRSGQGSRRTSEIACGSIIGFAIEYFRARLHDESKAGGRAGEADDAFGRSTRA